MSILLFDVSLPPQVTLTTPLESCTSEEVILGTGSVDFPGTVKTLEDDQMPLDPSYFCHLNCTGYFSPGSRLLIVT